MRAPRLWRVLLLLYPRAFREDHAAEIERFIADERAERVRGGDVRASAFWLRMALDLVRGAIRLRSGDWREGRAQGGGPRRSEADRTRTSSVVGGSGPTSPIPRRRLPAAPAGALGDLRFVLRGLRRTPALAATVVLTLGLGIGFNTAIFSVVHAVLLEPLAYPDAERLVYVQASRASDGVVDALHSGGDYRAIREGVEALAGAAAIGTIRQNLTGVVPPRRISVGWASHNLFEVLGVNAHVGRAFEPHDPPGTIVLSHALWSSALGEDPGVVGRSIALDGHPYTVVGVMPEGFRVHPGDRQSDAEVWKLPDDWWQNGDAWAARGAEFGLFRIVGRLAEGATVESARSQLGIVASDLRARHPSHATSGLELTAKPLLDQVVKDARPTLVMLLGAVAVVLLIACANVTNLLLARTHARSQEVALRTALGASRVRLVGLLLAESATLAGLGSMAGVLLAVVGTRVLGALAPFALPRAEEIGLAPGVLLFTLGVAGLSAVLVGLAPAVGILRGEPDRDPGAPRGTSPGVRGRFGGALVVTQIALSIVLVTTAGLLVSSLVRLHRVDPGFDPADLLTFSVSVPGTHYGWPDEADRFFRDLEGRIAGLPGVSSAGVVWPMPMGGSGWSEAYVAGDVGEETRAYADYRLATPSYFGTIGVELLEGRGFRADDERHVALVSRTLAERAWPGRPAMGQTVRARPWGGELEAFDVIGVVEDLRYADLREAAAPTVYFDSRGWAWTDWEVDVLVRASTHPMSLVEPIRAELLALDASIPLDRPRTMSDVMAAQLASNQFALWLVGLFATVAGLLALVGLYGLLSYTVSRRIRDIGIRMALGSKRHRILSLVLYRGLRLTALGTAIGVAAAAVATRFISSFLFGTSATDPVTFAAVVAGFTLFALVAAYLPARRATSLDPVTVLRGD